MKISACLIAKNEEKVIARCIESYRAAVDEIIVVDTGSADETVTVAESLGAKVFHFNWINDFAAAKNYAISLAKGDWIIFLDADEYFVNGTGGNIRTYIKEIDKGFNSIACKMMNIDQPNQQILSEITHVRIFKNDKYIRYVNPIHEMLYNFRKNKKMNAILVDKQELLIYHSGYSQDNQRDKAQRNLALLLQQLPQATTNPVYYHYIADCYFTLGEWDKVLEYTKLFLDSKTKLVGHNVRPSNILIDAMLQLKYPYGDVMREINIAIDKFPQHPVFYFYKGKMLYDSKHYDAAFCELRQALQLHENYNDIESNSLAVNLNVVYSLMAAVSEFRNDCMWAVEYYVKSLQLDKTDITSFDRLLKLIRNQPVQDIILFLNNLYEIENETDLDFLANRLVNHATPKVLAYYINLREKRYAKQDFFVLQMLVANGHYDKAFAAIVDCYESDKDERLALAAATAAALSGNKAYMTQAIEILPPAYGNILKAYRGDLILLCEADRDTFLGLVRTFILWAGDDIQHKMLAVGGQSQHNMDAAIAQLFLNQGHYQAALAHFNAAVDYSLINGILVHPVLYFNQGYCLQRLYNPAAAVEAFVKAYEAGYRDNDIYDYLRWNVDKLNDGRVKARAEEILRAEAERIF